MLPENMKISWLKEPGLHEIGTAPVPSPKPGEVLIRVKNIGICGSDIHMNAGTQPDVEYPVIQGHEMSGIIADANGSAVFKDGDHVVAMPQTFCSECDYCKEGLNNHCRELKIIGVHMDGFAQEYVALNERWILPIPEDMPFDIGAMVEPLAVSVHAVSMAGDVKGKNVLVVGAGVIGNLAAQVAALKGANVMIAGRTGYRLDLARQFGIGLCVNTGSEDLSEAVAAHFGRDGADVAIEAIGVADSVNESFRQCKKRGRVVISGIFGQYQAIDLFTLQDKELNVVGTMMYTIDDFKESISLASTGRVQLKPLATAVFPVERFDEAYEVIENKSMPVMKVLVEM